jgi:hypothetical protein
MAKNEKSKKQSEQRLPTGWEQIEGYDPTKTFGEQCTIFKDILLKTNKIRTADQDLEYKSKLKMLTDAERLENDDARLRDAITLKDFLVVLLDTLSFWDGVEEGTVVGSGRHKVRLLQQDSILNSMRRWITMHRIESTIDLPPTPTDFLGAFDWAKTVEKLIAKADKDPDHLITITVSVKNFDVSRATLNRAIKDSRLKRYGKTSQIKVDAVEVAKLWPLRKSSLASNS